MLFAAPLWLLALIPWGALLAYLLTGRRRVTAVPFVGLWRGPVENPQPKRSIRPPSLPLLAALAALLLAILAASGPALGPGGTDPPITVILDRGLTMSATTDGQTRYARAASALDAALAREGWRGHADVRPVPPQLHEIPSAGDSIAAQASQFFPTAVDTSDELRAAVASALASSPAVLVITDDPVAQPNDRVILVPPDADVEDTGIVSIAVRAAPAPQAMVRIANHSARRTANLTVSSSGQQVARPIDLPPRGQARDYFIDPPAVAQVVEASIDGNDDIPANDRAWVVRRSARPRLEIRSDIPPELRRVIDVYAKRRPPDATSKRVAIVSTTDAFPADVPSVAVAPRGIAGTPLDAGAPLQIADSPLTAGVGDWSRALADATILEPPAGGWSPVVSVGGKVAVASRAGPVRQVWVGLRSAAWPRTPDFVVFWANVFDWLGEGGDAFGARLTGPLEGSWTRTDPTPPGVESVPPGLWPGLYQSADGKTLLALSAPPFPTARHFADPSSVRALRAAVNLSAAVGRRPLTRSLLLAALACLALAALAWPASSRSR